jgi:DNA-binding transcriptional LysR family regulator
MVGLEIESDQSESLIKRSEQGEFDLAYFKQGIGARHGTIALLEEVVWVGGPTYCPDPLNSLPLILFPEGCAYRRFAIAALKEQDQPWHLSFVSPSFDCLKSAAMEGLGVTVLARKLVAPPLHVIRPGPGLPHLPSVELAYAYGRRSNSRAVFELANHLTDSLSNGSAPA